jgi:hypothetical protein
MSRPAHDPSWPEAAGYTPHDRELVVMLWNHARTARLSELYYGQRLTALTRWNLFIEIAIAVTASGSGISGLDVLKTGFGASLWPYLAALTAFLAIAKPLLALDRRMRHATQQQQTYRRVLATLENLAFDIEQAGRLSAEHRQRFQRARDTLRQAEEQDDGDVAPATLGPLQDRVKSEMPADRLWVPEPPLAGSPV